ncbi:MAG: extracellular solute-binding protein [Candidatus Hydrogenedentes bacterium]|nr:extracellular solute-binding protein [Candidatus Hydrogenedentota bacterium]
MRKTYAIWVLGAMLCLGIIAILRPSEAGSPEERAALNQGRTVIVYWDRHYGHEHAMRAKLIEEYNTTQGIADGVYVRALPIGNSAIMEKLLTAVASGSPPDACSIDSGILMQLATQGCFTSLSDYADSIPALKQDRFLPHTWAMVSFEGYNSNRRAWVDGVWGIPTTTEAYCLLWNKDAFRRAGLDPERPPRTIRELEEYAARLTIREGSETKQVGFVPWFPWDMTLMWGGLFGGTWYDSKTGYATCASDSSIVASLAWQGTFSETPNSATNAPYALDSSKFQSFEKMGAYQSANNPFYAGKVAMIIEGEWQVTFIEKYASHLDWGVAPIPQPEDAPPRAYGPACICDAVPSSAKHKDEAFKFLRWFYAPRSETATSPCSDFNYTIHNIPCTREEALQDRFMKDPKFSVFVNELLTKPEIVTHPLLPQPQLFLDEIERAREFVILHEKSPEQAAQEIETRTNEVLGDTYRQMKKLTPE